MEEGVRREECEGRGVEGGVWRERWGSDGKNLLQLGEKKVM